MRDPFLQSEWGFPTQLETYWVLWHPLLHSLAVAVHDLADLRQPLVAELFRGGLAGLFDVFVKILHG